MEITRYFPGDDPLTPTCTGYYTMPVYTDEPVRTAGGGWESAAQVGIAVRDSAQRCSTLLLQAGKPVPGGTTTAPRNHQPCRVRMWTATTGA